MTFMRRKTGHGLAPGIALLASLLVAFSLLWGAAPGWAAAPPAADLQNVALQADSPECKSCHPDEQADWENSPHANATLDPEFQEQLQQQHNQEACLQCHTTGFDITAQTFMAEGVTCEACHGEYKEGHPAAGTMALPMESETCRSCHQTTFVEWEQSAHGQRNFECFDCHLSHSQGLRTGGEETLCAACHSSAEAAESHALHPIEGIPCSGCHMAEQMSGSSSPHDLEVAASSHSFAVASDACVQCHMEADSASSAETATLVARQESESEVLVQRAALADTLEDQVQALEDRIAGLRNVAVMGMGLAFGIGGFIGLAVGLVAMALLRRPKPSEEEQE